MTSLADVFAVLNRLRDDGLVTDYAIAGATAALFYVEPTRTYDVDVLVSLPPDTAESLSPLSDIYAWATREEYVVDAEHVMIHDVPVQFLPTYNDLVADAIASARAHDYDGVNVRVVDPEHLVALALQAGGARRRERAWQILEAGGADRTRLRDILSRHAIDAVVPDDD